MGLTSAIISGIAGGEATADFERRVLGEGDRGCNGRQSRSYSVAIASKFKCRYIDRIELGLDRATLTPKYTRGVGCYMPDPLSTTNPKPLLYLGNPPPGGRCRIPSSCRTDCDGFTHFWNSFKKSFTHLDSQGLARRLIASGCGFASTGTDCFGTQCAVYKKVGQEAYNEFGRELERRVAKEIEKFRDSGLGIALSWAPLAGSFADIFM